MIKLQTIITNHMRKINIKETSQQTAMRNNSSPIWEDRVVQTCHSQVGYMSQSSWYIMKNTDHRAPPVLAQAES